MHPRCWWHSARNRSTVQEGKQTLQLPAAMSPHLRISLSKPPAAGHEGVDPRRSPRQRGCCALQGPALLLLLGGACLLLPLEAGAEGTEGWKLHCRILAASCGCQQIQRQPPPHGSHL